jgi:hypothetical protein
MKRRNFLHGMMYAALSSMGGSWLIGRAFALTDPAQFGGGSEWRARVSRRIFELTPLGGASGGAGLEPQVQLIGSPLKVAQSSSTGQTKGTCHGGKTTCSDGDTKPCPDWHICGSAGHGGTCTGYLYCDTGKSTCKNKVCKVPF